MRIFMYIYLYTYIYTYIYIYIHIYAYIYIPYTYTYINVCNTLQRSQFYTHSTSCVCSSKLTNDQQSPGFLGTCPSNLGTGLRASVMIKIPELNKDPHALEAVCDAFDLQVKCIFL